MNDSKQQIESLPRERGETVFVERYVAEQVLGANLHDRPEGYETIRCDY